MSKAIMINPVPSSEDIDYMKYVNNIEFNGIVFPVDYDLVINNIPNLLNPASGMILFSNTVNIRSVDITFQNGVCSSLLRAFYMTDIQRIKLRGITFKHGISWQQAFYGARKLIEIDAELDLYNASSVNAAFTRCEKLQIVKFKKNSINITISFYDCPLLNTNSLISIANGLNEDTALSITFNDLQKSNLSAIIGLVSLSEDGTYHIFTENETGDTTLQDFITDVKGWTIA